MLTSAFFAAFKLLGAAPSVLKNPSVIKNLIVYYCLLTDFTSGKKPMPGIFPAS